MYHLRRFIPCQPNVFVGILHRREIREKVPGRRKRQRRTTYASAPKSHHLRATVKQRFDSQHLKRTDFGARRQCMAQTGNVFALKSSANGKHKNPFSMPSLAVHNYLYAPAQWSGLLYGSRRSLLLLLTRTTNITSRRTIVSGPGSCRSVSGCFE